MIELVFAVQFLGLLFCSLALTLVWVLMSGAYSFVGLVAGYGWFRVIRS